MSNPSPKQPQRNVINPFDVGEMIGPDGNILSKEEVSERLRRKGKCPHCGLVRTHTGQFHFRMKPITKAGEVYKGYCLKCHDIDEIKRSLGVNTTENGGTSDNDNNNNSKNERKSLSFGRSLLRKSARKSDPEVPLVPPDIGGMPSTVTFSSDVSSSDASSLGFPSVSSLGGGESLTSGSSSTSVVSTKDHNAALAVAFTTSEEPPFPPNETASSGFSVEDQDNKTGPTVDNTTLSSSDSSDQSTLSPTSRDYRKCRTLPEIPEDKLNDESDENRKKAAAVRLKIHKFDKETSKNMGSTVSDSLDTPSSVVGAQHESPSNSTSSLSSHAATVEQQQQQQQQQHDPKSLQTLMDQCNSGDFRGALETMRRESGSISLLLSGLELLRDAVPLKALKSKSTNTSQLLPPSWVKIIVTCIMSRHCTHPNLQSEAIRTIWTMSSLHLKYKTDVTTQNGVDAIVDAMERFPLDRNVQMYGAGALSCLCDSDRHAVQVRLVRKSADCIVGALEYTTNDGCVEEWAIRALHGLSIAPGGMLQLFEEEKRRLEKLPGVILGVMSRLSFNANIQLWACRLMWVLLDEITEQRQNDDIEDTEISISSIFFDATILLSEDMAVHRDDELLHEAACGFIQSSFSSGVIVVESSLLSTKIQTISESILDSMKAHPTSATLQLYGCRAICGICSMRGNEENTCAVFSQLGSIDVIIQSMQDHTDNLFLQAEACGAIASLCAGAPWTKDTISDLGGVKAIANAYLSHKRSISTENSYYLVEKACMALATISTSSKCITTLQSLGILDSIIDTIETIDSGDNSDSESLNMALSNILFNILADSQSKGSSGLNQICAADGALLALKMLKTCTDEERLVCVIKFLHFFSDTTDCVDIILSNGGRGQLMDVMRSYSESATIQEMSCLLFSRIYAKVQNHASTDARSEDEISIISTAMKNHRGQPSVQSAACLALRNFCTTPESLSDRTIAELFECINDVAQASKIHCSSEVVQENVCGAFWAILTTSDAMAVSVASSGGTWCILDAMSSFPTSAPLQNAACDALLSLTIEQENLMAIGSERGINVIIHCLSQFDNDLEIAERVCSIMAILSSDLPQAAFVVINHAAAVKQLIECMSRFPQSETIQMACSEIVSNISGDNYVANNIVGLGGIEKLSTAMKGHADNPIVLEKACIALEKIIPESQNDIVAGSKVAQQMIDCLKKYPNNVKIQMSSVSVLFLLSLNDRSNKAVIAGLGGIPEIISSMRNHLDCVPLQQKGCKMLWSLCVLEQNQVAVGQCGGIQTIISSMKEHLTDAAVQTEALGALKALAVLIPNKDTIINSGGVDCIVETMLVHGENEKIIKSCFGALSNIAVNPYTNKVKIMTRAEFNAVVDSMHRFSMSEDVQLNGCRLLRNYTFSPSNVKLMKENELLPVLIQSAAINFPSSCGERAQYLLNVF